MCDLTSKGYNRLFVDLIKKLRREDSFSGAAIRKFLLDQTAEISVWPTDETFEEKWVSTEIYRRLAKAATRMILEALETALHTDWTERVQVEHQLTIEHLMPRSWEEHWPLTCEGSSEETRREAARVRNQVVHQIGNLTLLTRKLNPSVSNGPWEQKRREILKYSALNLNRSLQDNWNEAQILQRSKQLLDVALKIWPRPNS